MPGTNLTLTPAGGGPPVNLTSVRLVTPWKGVWFADVTVDAADLANAPTSGKVAISIDTESGALQGTIDPRAAGTFVQTASLRVLAGAGAWEQPVTAQHFQPATGSLSASDVIVPTAALVGETVNLPNPAPLGPSFVRGAGPARRVLDSGDWYVDLAGVTQVQPRPAAAPDASLELLEWDPVAQRGRLVCDAVVLPNTTITDARLGAPVVIRDVEQTWHGGGSEVVVWCATGAVSRLAAAIDARIHERAKGAELRVYRYRVVLQGDDGRLRLQAMVPAAGMPDTLPLSIWPGMQGDSAKVKLSSECLVEFVHGDPKLPPTPVVRGFSGDALPVERTVDATSALHLGPSAESVDLAGGGSPVARQGDQVMVFLPPTLPVVGTVSGSPFAGTITVANPVTGVITQGSTKASSG